MLKFRKALPILTLFALIFVCSTLEAGWLRRGRVIYRTTHYSFTGDAQAVCQQKAELQAKLGRMFHPGGGFGGGNCEGVGCAGNPDAALNSCCYSKSGRVILGQAVVRSHNGLYYACRIFQ